MLRDADCHSESGQQRSLAKRVSSVALQVLLRPREVASIWRCLLNSDFLHIAITQVLRYSHETGICSKIAGSGADLCRWNGTAIFLFLDGTITPDSHVIKQSENR